MHVIPAVSRTSRFDYLPKAINYHLLNKDSEEIKGYEKKLTQKNGVKKIDTFKNGVLYKEKIITKSTLEDGLVLTKCEINYLQNKSANKLVEVITKPIENGFENIVAKVSNAMGSAPEKIILKTLKVQKNIKPDNLIETLIKATKMLPF